MSIRWRLTLFNALAIEAVLGLMSLALVLLLSEVLLDGIEKTTSHILFRGAFWWVYGLTWGGG